MRFFHKALTNPRNPSLFPFEIIYAIPYFNYLDLQPLDSNKVHHRKRDEALIYGIANKHWVSRSKKQKTYSTLYRKHFTQSGWALNYRTLNLWNQRAKAPRGYPVRNGGLPARQTWSSVLIRSRIMLPIALGRKQHHIFVASL